MVSILRVELDALKAEVRRLRREVGRGIAEERIRADFGPGDASLTLSRSQLAEAWALVSDRRVRFPGDTWQQIEALPQPAGSCRWAQQSRRSKMRWEDLYDEIYDADDDRAEIERLKTRLLADLKAYCPAQARKSRGLTQRMWPRRWA
jgi:hypothetical protein